MAIKLQSADLYQILQSGELDANLTHQAYNALDSSVTLRVWEKLKPLIEASPHATTSYQFVRAMQGPALSMMRTGIMVQQLVRQNETQRYLVLKEKAQALLDRLADAVWGPETYVVKTKREEWHTPIGKRGQPLQPRRRVCVEEHFATRPRGLGAGSAKQCLAFFNTALGLPIAYEIRKTSAGTERTPTSNDKALRKWAERRMKGPGIDPRDRTIAPLRLAAPFVSLILSIRDADKCLVVLRSALDPDGRARCSYNVVGAETGRWSSSKNAFGRGQNQQNITESMRRMFCADDGYRMVSTDLEQAEPRLVGGVVWQATGDEAYWNATHSADTHTTVASMTWPEFGWCEDVKENRRIADQPCRDHPVYTYREVSKRLSNGTNYYGTPYGLAAEVGIPANLVQDFQARYFSAFPAIRRWHAMVKEQVQTLQYVDTPLGRRRWLFGRPNEDKTLREAIAHIPQSTIAELLNLIMWKVWRRSLLPRTDPAFLPIQLLLQNHDAFAFQTPIAENLPRLIELIDHEFTHTPIPLERNGEHKSLIIPGEFVTGFNWAYKDKGSEPSKWTFPDVNPDGLIKFGGTDDRVRQQRAAVAPSEWLSTPQAPRFSAR